MAKQRQVNTCFRSDPYVENLDPSEKLLFLYFLTNEHTDLCGIYEISIKKISYETGFEKSMVEKVISRFSKDGKVFYHNGYVYVKNFQKHQKTSSPKIKQGIERSMSKIPREVLDFIYSIDTLYIPYTYPIAPILIPIPIGITSSEPIPEGTILPDEEVSVGYITNRQEMNDFVSTLPEEKQEWVKSKRLAIVCLLDSQQWYPIKTDIKFICDWVDWLTETCTRYGYVDEFGKVTWDTITQKFLRMKEWLQENKQGQIVSLKRTVHTFLDPERQKGKPNK